jgi:hypothetical protein
MILIFQIKLMYKNTILPREEFILQRIQNQMDIVERV